MPERDTSFNRAAGTREHARRGTACAGGRLETQHGRHFQAAGRCLRFTRSHRVDLRRRGAAAVDRAQRAVLQRGPEAGREPEAQPAAAGRAASLLRRGGPRAGDAPARARGRAGGRPRAAARGAAGGGARGAREGRPGARELRLAAARGVVAHQGAARFAGPGGGRGAGAQRRALRQVEPPREGRRRGGRGAAHHRGRRGAGRRALPLLLRLRAPAAGAGVLRDRLHEPRRRLGDPGQRAVGGAALRERLHGERRALRSRARDGRAVLRGGEAAAALPRPLDRAGGAPAGRRQDRPHRLHRRDAAGGSRPRLDERAPRAAAVAAQERLRRQRQPRAQDAAGSHPAVRRDARARARAERGAQGRVLPRDRQGEPPPHPADQQHPRLLAHRGRPQGVPAGAERHRRAWCATSSSRTASRSRSSASR